MENVIFSKTYITNFGTNKDGHVICMREVKNALKIQAGKLETKTLLWGPRRNGGGR
jgi:hypothetical protein